MKFQIMIASFACLFAFNTYASEKAAKEDTTPPSMDGPLTVEQIPPIESLPQSVPQAVPPSMTQ